MIVKVKKKSASSRLSKNSKCYWEYWRHEVQIKQVINKIRLRKMIKSYKVKSSCNGVSGVGLVWYDEMCNSCVSCERRHEKR